MNFNFTPHMNITPFKLEEIDTQELVNTLHMSILVDPTINGTELDHIELVENKHGTRAIYATVIPQFDRRGKTIPTGQGMIYIFCI